MLMSLSNGETAVHSCHCLRDIAVRVRELMARPWVGVCEPLALIYWWLVIHLPRACRGRTAVRFPANSSHVCCVELALDRLLCTQLGSKGLLRSGFYPHVATLVGPNKGETAVCGCHWPRHMAVRVREVLPRPWVGVRRPLALTLH